MIRLYTGQDVKEIASKIYEDNTFEYGSFRFTEAQFNNYISNLNVIKVLEGDQSNCITRADVVSDDLNINYIDDEWSTIHEIYFDFCSIEGDPYALIREDNSVVTLMSLCTSALENSNKLMVRSSVEISKYRVLTFHELSVLCQNETVRDPYYFTDSVVECIITFDTVSGSSSKLVAEYSANGDIHLNDGRIFTHDQYIKHIKEQNLLLVLAGKSDMCAVRVKVGELDVILGYPDYIESSNYEHFIEGKYGILAMSVGNEVTILDEGSFRDILAGYADFIQSEEHECFEKLFLVDYVDLDNLTKRVVLKDPRNLLESQKKQVILIDHEFVKDVFSSVSDQLNPPFHYAFQLFLVVEEMNMYQEVTKPHYSHRELNEEELAHPVYGYRLDDGIIGLMMSSGLESVVCNGVMLTSHDDAIWLSGSGVNDLIQVAQIEYKGLTYILKIDIYGGANSIEAIKSMTEAKAAFFKFGVK